MGKAKKKKKRKITTKKVKSIMDLLPERLFLPLHSRLPCVSSAVCERNLDLPFRSRPSYPDQLTFSPSRSASPRVDHNGHVWPGKARFWATSPVLACWGARSVCAVPGHTSFGQCSTEVSLAQTPDLGTPGCRGKVKREAQPGPLAWIRLQIKTYPTHVMG